MIWKLFQSFGLLEDDHPCSILKVDNNSNLSSIIGFCPLKIAMAYTVDLQNLARDDRIWPAYEGG